MNFRDRVHSGGLIFFDGAMGTMLQSEGLKPGESSEMWNITHAEVVSRIHSQYLDAGCNVVTANTFGCNLLKYDKSTLEQLIGAAIENAKSAVACCMDQEDKYIALDIGPLEKMLKPLGELSFEDAVGIYAETVRIGVKNGVDLILIETMTDLYETKAALLAAKEACDLPVIVSNAYEENGRLMTGASPEAVIATLEGMHPDAIGVNCSFGPEMLKPVVSKYLQFSSVPVLVQPNAGMPIEKDGRAFYAMAEETYAGYMCDFASDGVQLLGGCCGTRPEYIRAMINACKDVVPHTRKKGKDPVIASGTDALYPVMNQTLLIGERINPTGKKRMKEALRNHDLSYILSMAVEQREAGAHILDINAGIPDICEEEMLAELVTEVQAVCSLPLQIDSNNAPALERALRVYNGKALVNSVNGTKESMNHVFPLVQKYGGMVIALTLDENGIPDSVEGRVEIAEKIIKEARKYGIDERDLIFDPLTMAVSANTNAADLTLKTVAELHQRGRFTSLGVSNVSFGLPGREEINAAFYLSAVRSGLSFAIMNPCSVTMMRAYHLGRLLCGHDDNCSEYISFTDNHPSVVSGGGTSLPIASPGTNTANENNENPLENAVFRGLKAEAAEITAHLLRENRAPLDIINQQIIPALNRVGESYEKKELYLPQLLMSAEAAGAAFEVIKSAQVSDESSKAEGRMQVILATVQGDIHDIGKNIVKLLLENYNFNVIDLGRDVSPELILEKVLETGAPLCGLSALMTTTVPAMAKTIELIKKSAPHCKVVVGGAVLTEDYAAKIGADCYAKDAMATVRYAQKLRDSL